MQIQRPAPNMYWYMCLRRGHTECELGVVGFRHFVVNSSDFSIFSENVEYINISNM